MTYDRGEDEIQPKRILKARFNIIKVSADSFNCGF